MNRRSKCPDPLDPTPRSCFHALFCVTDRFVEVLAGCARFSLSSTPTSFRSTNFQFWRGGVGAPQPGPIGNNDRDPLEPESCPNKSSHDGLRHLCVHGQAWRGWCDPSGVVQASVCVLLRRIFALSTPFQVRRGGAGVSPRACCSRLGV